MFHFLPEEQIRREVEHALFVQKLSRARKAKKSASGAHETRADSSPESKWYNRDSFVNRARARQNSAYTPKMAPSGDFWYNGELIYMHGIDIRADDCVP